jgi:hypothetical protein
MLSSMLPQVEEEQATPKLGDEDDKTYLTL